MPIYTVGHGARRLDDLVAILRSAGVGTLVDVRRFPGSRTSPHFAKDALEATLPRAGIRYEWRGDVLGGRRRPSPRSRHVAWESDSFRGYADHLDLPDVRAALDELAARAEEEPPLALLCAEILWWRCHRRLLADALEIRGARVVHLRDAGLRERHRVHPSLRVEPDGRLTYA